MQPQVNEPVERLLDQGVQVRVPSSVDIGPEVDLDAISGDDVVIYPGTRIYGERTVVSAGARLGAEGPVTVSNCQLGPGVELKGGYAADSVFLEGAGLGLGHHVRAGCLLEEQANGAHTVGLKQTILLPFVTLGSLINFCDVLMAGGTSRRQHSEVGSSYIHFNFTPNGDKATPSLFGDVPHGVLLDQAPIFLGGQGGTVGPVQVAFGTVVGAGSVLRTDVAEPGRLVVVGAPPNLNQPFRPGRYRSVDRLVARNLEFLANLRALRLWYEQVREPFFAAQDLGLKVYQGALAVLDLAWSERVHRLTAVVDKLGPDEGGELAAGLASVCRAALAARPDPDRAFRSAMTDAAADGVSYLDAVRALPDPQRAAARAWLVGVTDQIWARAAQELPAVRRLSPAALPAPV